MRTLAAALAAAFIVTLAPAAAAQPMAAPQPAASGYAQGRAARLAGEPAKAAAILRTWLADHPGDDDARIELAYAELALGRPAAAEALFREVAARDPARGDARDGLALARHRSDGARGVRPGGYVLVEGALSALSGAAQDWREVALDAGAALSPSSEAGARASWYRRFGRQDLELVARVALHPNDGLWLRARAGGTPHADFRPRRELGAGLDYRIAGGADATLVTLDADYARYPLQDVVTLQPGVVRYVAAGKAWLTLRGVGTIANGGRLRIGAQLRGDYAPQATWRVFGGAAHAPDTDLGLVTQVTSLFGGAELPLGKAFAVDAAFARDWRKGSFDRTELRLGVKARF